MQDLFSLFSIELVPGSVKRIQIDDDTYFGPEYKDYVSNSKMGLLNPAQGGSPQKFFEGFKSSKSSALSLGSAVHQLTLESNDYELSDVYKPGFKLGDAYVEFLKNRQKGLQLEESMVLACISANYYSDSIKSYTGNSLPGFMKKAITGCLEYHKTITNSNDDGKKIIYLPKDQHTKCCKCVNSISRNVKIQKELTVPLSYCEDVILCEMKVTFPKDFSNPEGEKVTEFVKLKMKADHWSIDHTNKIFTLNDVKTTGKPLQYFMGYTVEEEGLLGATTHVFKNGSFQTFHYSRQMAMYLWMLRVYIEQEYGNDYKMTSNMLVVETVGNFNSELFPINNDIIQSGFTEFKQLLKRVAYHQRNGYESILELEDPNTF